MKIETTATFIGHSECYGMDSKNVTKEIEKLILCGVTDFLSRGQGSFDRLCGRCVFELKKHYPHIKNHLVIPYLTFQIYNKDLFDSIIYPDDFEKYHFKAAIPARNKYLVNNSLVAI